MLVAKHLLFNASILIGILFIYHLWTERFGKKQSKIVWFNVLFLSLVICFIFSLPVSDVYRYDLRIVPVVIAGLYFGMGWIFVGLAIFFRSLLGIDNGFYISSSVYIFLGFVIHSLSPWFLKQKPLNKNVIGMGITFIANGLLILIRHQLYEPVWNMSLPFLFIPTIVIGVFIYVIEYLKFMDQFREEMVQTKKMVALEHLGAAISHELRNPLTSARGFLQLIQEEKSLNDDVKRYVHIASEELNQAEQVIQDYLTFTKPSLEEVVELDVCTELQYVVSTVYPLANLYSVTIQTDLAPIPPIWGDRAKFRQCLFNVIKNGIESMPRGGVLTLSTKKADKNISVTIKDTGTGMTREQMNRIGEPYYSTKEGNGTGLGLMVVKSILKAFNGQLKVSSEVGQGTKMTLLFPSSRGQYDKTVNYRKNRGITL